MNPTALCRGLPLLLVTLVALAGFGQAANLKISRWRRAGFDWKTADFTKPAMAADVPVKAKAITPKPGEILVNGITVDFLDARPPPGTPQRGECLLLPGTTDTPETWAELKTIQTLAAAGIRTIAINLAAEARLMKKEDRQSWLHDVVKTLGLQKPTVVGPSSSGLHALPLVMGYPNDVTGFVPIAPQGTQHYKEDEYRACKVPTLIVRGANDVYFGKFASEKLTVLGNAQELLVPGGWSRPYNDNPSMFNTCLINFVVATHTYSR